MRKSTFFDDIGSRSERWFDEDRGRRRGRPSAELSLSLKSAPKFLHMR